jgi:hypothetical protein
MGTPIGDLLKSEQSINWIDYQRSLYRISESRSPSPISWIQTRKRIELDGFALTTLSRQTPELLQKPYPAAAGCNSDWRSTPILHDVESILWTALRKVFVPKGLQGLSPGF